MDKKLTIAFYCSSLSWGGLEMNVLKRAQWMKKKGHTALLFCVKDTPIHVEAVKSGTGLVLINRNKKSVDLINAIRLKKRLKEQQAEVIWFADKRDLSLVFLVKILIGKKLISLFQQSMQIGVNKKQWWHTIRFKRIDLWVAPMNYLKEQLSHKTNYPLERVHVVHQGVEIQPFLNNLPLKKEARAHFNLKETDVVFGMIGRIDFAKAQQFVKKVMVDVISDHDNVKMLFVGNKTEGEWEDYYNELASDINENHANGDIQLFPFMKEVGCFYAAIDIFIMASKNETYGMVTVEAMLSGKKILGTNTAGTKELLDHGSKGYYFNWMDEDSLKNSIEEILNNPEQAEQKAQVAQRYSKTAFSHVSELEQIERLLFNRKKAS